MSHIFILDIFQYSQNSIIISFKVNNHSKLLKWLILRISFLSSLLPTFFYLMIFVKMMELSGVYTASCCWTPCVLFEEILFLIVLALHVVCHVNMPLMQGKVESVPGCWGQVSGSWINAGSKSFIINSTEVYNSID